MKQTIAATSSNHAEILAIHEASCECAWLRSMTQHIRVDCGMSEGKDASTIMYEDNATCIAQLKDAYIKGDRTKHILLKFFFTHELQKAGEVQVLQVRSSDNSAVTSNINVQEAYALDRDASTERHSVRSKTRGVIRVVLFFLHHDFIPLGFPGHKSLSRLKNLKTLDLSSNGFNNSVFPFLNAATSLTTISLRKNLISGPFTAKELKDLTNLELLDLSLNVLNGSMSDLTHLKNLRALDLSFNYFSKSLELQELKNLSNLEVLGVARNYLDGPIPVEVICEMKNLRELDLRGNYFVGSLTKLRFLDLSSNQFCGNLPSSFSNLESLEYLSLSENNFTGLFSLSPLTNLAKLKVFKLSSTFDMIQMPAIVHHHLKVFDFSANDIGGSFPGNIGSAFPNLVRMNCSSNGFQGNLPSSVGEMNNILFMDLSYNNFSGKPPSSLFKGCYSLTNLKLSNNKFSGHFLSTVTGFPSLGELRIDNNLFTGPIGIGLLCSTKLSVLDMSNNCFTGAIPRWISKLSSLDFLVLSNNLLEGTIPSSLLLMPYPSFMDLSRNKFSGALPSRGLRKPRTYLFLHDNNFTGPIPHTLLKGVHVLDLRNNKLSGSIPHFVDAQYISIILLRGNSLTGSIPKQLCDMRNIRLLDLSNNKLDGFIPSCLSNLSFGSGGEEMADYSTFGFSQASSQPNLELEFYKSTFVVEKIVEDTQFFTRQEFEIQFAVKQRYESYAGGSKLRKVILDYMYGIDMSNNELSGVIPAELGYLSELRVLNLSHNFLLSTIPSSFSNLKAIESLDLSYNMLQGRIPHQLTSLTFLVVFSISYNNLSGSFPQGYQFNTFNESNYLGNPLLCASSTNIYCDGTKSSEEADSEIEDEEEDEVGVDMLLFYYSTASTYLTALIGIIVLMYFDCPWRQAWLRIIDAFITSAKLCLLKIISD
ncbi:hypothetical protein N665_0148s0015 [Sinapis alba]|nr:hypothetical protein N665_0148s0015 [Sinapis alba]